MGVVVLLVCFVVLPAAYLYTLLNRAVTRKTQGLRLSFLVFLAAIVTAAWALGQVRRTGWAPYAWYAVQGEAALAGFLVLAFTKCREAPSRPVRMLGWAGLVASVLIIAFNVALGIQNISANRAAQFRPITRPVQH
jgi:bacteriorhodopsin